MSEKRVSQPVVRYEGVDSPTAWSTVDKCTLLKALRKHGHTDIKRIAEALPNKSVVEIKTMIVNTMMAARRSTKSGQTAPIDMWLAQASSDETNALIPQALLFISMFERHPSPENCNGCDLRAAYDYVYRMTRGHSPVELDRRTRRMIFKVISRTVLKMRLKTQDNLIQFISNLYKASTTRDYTRRTGSTQKIGTHEVVQELNTFNVPSDQLRIFKN